MVHRTISLPFLGLFADSRWKGRDFRPSHDLYLRLPNFLKGTYAMTHQKLLFISPDEFSLTDGAILHVCPPLDRQIVLKAERPWESRFIAFYTTILKIGREYRLYYTCRDTTGFGSLCLAVSQDGVHFQRPDLGLREYHGSRHNNMLNIDSLEGNVLILRRRLGTSAFSIWHIHIRMAFFSIPLRTEFTGKSAPIRY